MLYCLQQDYTYTYKGFLRCSEMLVRRNPLEDLFSALSKPPFYNELVSVCFCSIFRNQILHAVRTSSPFRTQCFMNVVERPTKLVGLLLQMCVVSSASSAGATSTGDLYTHDALAQKHVARALLHEEILRLTGGNQVPGRHAKSRTRFENIKRPDGLRKEMTRSNEIYCEYICVGSS